LNQNEQKIAALQAELSSLKSEHANMYNLEDCISAYKMEATKMYDLEDCISALNIHAEQVDKGFANEKQQLIQENAALAAEIAAVKKSSENNEILHADEVAKLKLVKKNRELWMETEVAMRTDELQGELAEQKRAHAEEVAKVAADLLNRDVRILALKRENKELKDRADQAELEVAAAMPAPLSRATSPMIMSPAVYAQSSVEDPLDIDSY
jgi:hypothetical protein